MGSAFTTLPRPPEPEVDMTSPEADMVRRAIAAHKVVIFSKTYCPYCTMAKDVFRKVGVPVFVIELDSRTDGEEIQNILGVITGSRTVPRCFINGEFVGGGTDVQKMYYDGTLNKHLLSP